MSKTLLHLDADTSIKALNTALVNRGQKNLEFRIQNLELFLPLI